MNVTDDRQTETTDRRQTDGR